MADTIGFDPVAWSVDGGRHNGELYRVLAYAATSGAEGIVSPGDCRVRQLTTPGGQVAVDAGALLVRNRSANVRNQTYAANGRAETRLDIRPTGAAPRSDLIIVRIEDPQYSPWSAVPPEQAPTFQYVRPFVLEGVSASTVNFWSLNLGYSAYALARVDIPANTTVITNAMIKDLRQVAIPRRHREVRVWSPPVATLRLDPADAGLGYKHFPVLNQLVACPEWATEMKIIVMVGNLLQRGDFTGGMRAEYGWNLPGNPFLATQVAGLHHIGPDSADDQDRDTILIADTLAIPADYRGKEHYVRTRSYYNNSAPKTGNATQDQWLNIVVDIEFTEKAV